GKSQSRDTEALGEAASHGSHAPDPRVDEHVDDVHEDVDHDEGEGDGERDSLDEEHVVALDSVEDELSHRLDVEDDLDDHGTADEVGEPQTEHGDRCDQRVPEHVPAHHHVLGDAGADRRPHIVTVQLLHHGGTHHPGE